MPILHFLGAAGTVTGSKYVVEANGRRLLIDAGLFQGLKELRLRNWHPLPVPPTAFDFVALTHAHIDHTGYLPAIVRDGFAGRVLCTAATADLLGLLLPDSGRLQEEEAETANRLGYSRHHPALPLYTEEDARAALPRLEPVPYESRHELGDGFALTFRSAGHILGSASIEVEVEERGALHRILFSGDVGRYGAPVIPDPVPVREATTLLVECTYGDREHGPIPPKEALARALCEAFSRDGAIVIPAFAIGRAQDLLYHLRELEDEARVPVLPVFVDSPMASDATPIYARHQAEHDQAMRQLLAEGRRPFHPRQVRFTRSAEESKAINSIRRCIIISASGMATGGRVLHHLRHRLPQARNTILFVGYQGEGTRGRLLLDGAKTIKIHGQQVPVEAQIRVVSGFSAHADRREMDRWLDGFRTAPTCTFCVHGEQLALEAMRRRLTEQRGWNARVPRYLERVDLAAAQARAS